MTAYAPAALVSATCGRWQLSLMRTAARVILIYETSRTSLSLSPPVVPMTNGTPCRAYNCRRWRGTSAAASTMTQETDNSHTRLCVRMYGVWVGIVNHDEVLLREQRGRGSQAHFLISTGCTYSTHRVALFQLLQRGGAVRHQLYVDACAGDALPCSGCCWRAQGRASPVQLASRSTPASGHSDGPLNATGRRWRPRWTAASAVAKPIFPVTPFTITGSAAPGPLAATARMRSARRVLLSWLGNLGVAALLATAFQPAALGVLRPSCAGITSPFMCQAANYVIPTPMASGGASTWSATSTLAVSVGLRHQRRRSALLARCDACQRHAGSRRHAYGDA